MSQIDRAPIDLNHHKGLIAADEITGEAFAVQGTGADGAINVNAILSVPGSLDTNLVEVGGAAISLGQTTMASSFPVTIASNQTALTVSLPTGASTADNQTNGAQLTQIVDAGGEAVTVTGGKLDVNATISGSGGGTSAIDDSAFTAGTDTGTPIMGFVTSDTVDSGDVGVVAMDTARNLKVIAQANSGVDIGDVTVNNGAGAAAVNIQDGGNTITVDGTVNAAQSGTWTVQPGNTANTTPWLVTGSGSAGSAATGVITVQGIASMTPIQVSQATASNLNATVVQGTATNLKTQAEVYQGGSAVASGNPLEVNIRSATGSINVAMNLAQVAGTTTSVAAGSVGNGTQRVVLATGATGTTTSVNDTASSTTLLAANAGRMGATIYNDSTVNLYVKLGATASATSFTALLFPQDYYEVPRGYNGIIDGIWASDASGAARITEIT